MPAKTAVIDFVKYFSTLEDPRMDRQKFHSLPDILFIVFCGSICGVETWEDFFDFGGRVFIRKHIAKLYQQHRIK